MSKNRKFIFLALLIIGLAFISALLNSNKNQNQKSQQTSAPQISGTKISQESTSQPTAKEQLIKVARVIDGDTIEIEDGQKVRYIGIDTPELVDPRKPVECFAQEAAAKNRQLVEGKIVELEKDISETDKYGRLLRYVYLPSEASAKEGGGETFVNDYLVRQGYAHASSYPPDVKYQDEFRQAEQEARQNQRGLWGQCPKDDQKQSITSNQTVPDSGCKIKGNISSSGEKIYHLPGQYYYDKTIIDQSRGEKWFCTEEEAITAGWRKSKK